jgi:hypothetical protein
VLDRWVFCLMLCRERTVFDLSHVCRERVVYTGMREGDAGSSWDVDELGHGFGQALMELLEAIKGFGPWKFLKSLGFGHFKRRPLSKPKSKPIFWCALKKTKSGSRLGCSSSNVDAGHGVPSCLDLESEAKAPDSPVTTSEDSRHSGCSSTSQVGVSDFLPSARVDVGYGPVLGVDPRMSLEVLGSSPSMFELDVTGPSSTVEVVSGMGSSSEFSSELVLEVLSKLDSSSGTTQKEVVLASLAVTPVFFAQPLFLSAFVWQDGLRRETTLLHRQH